MASVSERGFVDFIGDTLARTTEGNIAGVIDLYICASCMEQGARLVGSATQFETLEMAQMVLDKEEEIEKLKDEIMAHQQRYDNLIDHLKDPPTNGNSNRDSNGSTDNPIPASGKGSRPTRAKDNKTS